VAVLETEYLVVGGGASGMAFVDTLVAEADVDVVITDRRHAPGGHWVDAYPFVRLHQPSAYYGVNSLPLGHDRIDTSGINAGFYERASGDEIRAYYGRVLDQLLSRGRIRFLGNTDYLGEDADGHHLVSTLTGEATIVRARHRLVDATCVASAIPASHTPSFGVAPGARLLTPNGLARIGGPAPRFTIIGGGKTGMDVCQWLLDQGVDPDRIRWIRPRDGWFVDRAYTQPLDLVGSMVEYQARTVEACATARNGLDLALRLEEHGMFCRLDTSVEPTIYRGATIARSELEALRQVENVVRLGKVRSIGMTMLELERGEIEAMAGEVLVDCTAQGLATVRTRPIFAGERVTVQFTTVGVAPWSAAILGYVESLDLTDDNRNHLCPPVPRTGLIADQLRILGIGFVAEARRRQHHDIARWAATARLNPARAVGHHQDEPAIQSALARTAEHFEPAMANLTARG
jgi:hypothetical protein